MATRGRMTERMMQRRFNDGSTIEQRMKNVRGNLFGKFGVTMKDMSGSGDAIGFTLVREDGNGTRVQLVLERGHPVIITNEGKSRFAFRHASTILAQVANGELNTPSFNGAVIESIRLLDAEREQQASERLRASTESRPPTPVPIAAEPSVTSAPIGEAAILRKATVKETPVPKNKPMTVAEYQAMRASASDAVKADALKDKAAPTEAPPVAKRVYTPDPPVSKPEMERPRRMTTQVKSLTRSHQEKRQAEWNSYPNWLAAHKERAAQCSFNFPGFLSQVCEGVKKRNINATFEFLNEVECRVRVVSDNTNEETQFVLRAWHVQGKANHNDKPWRVVLIVELGGMQGAVSRRALVPMLWEMQNRHHLKFAEMYQFMDDVHKHYTKFVVAPGHWRKRKWSERTAARRMPA